LDEQYPVVGVYTTSLIQLMVAGAVLLALAHQVPGLAALGLAVMAIHVLSRLWSKLASSRTSARVRLDRSRAFPGDPVRLTLTVENQSRLPIWVQAAVGRDAQHPLELGPAETINTVLAGRSAAEMDWSLAPNRRGVYRVGPDRMIGGDLLGWFPKGLAGARPAELVVYPHLPPAVRIEAARLEYYGAAGARSPVVDPVYIMGARDWTPNRPARHIHWRASARLDRWQEKVFDPSAQVKALMMLDVSGFDRAGGQEDFERILSLLASLAVEYARRGYRSGLLANGGLAGDPSGLAADGSIRPVGLILELLARQTPVASRTLADLMVDRSGLAHRAAVILAFRQWDDTAEANAAALGPRNRSAVLIAARPGPGSPGGVMAVDDLIPPEARV
jgi:uncharacterized protein (DUF58 family)